LAETGFRKGNDLSEIAAPTFWQADPATLLGERCLVIAAGLPANPALSLEVCWSVRASGDWLAAVVSPAFIRIFLLPGGGQLWGDIPLGQQRYLALGNMDWRFLAAHDPVLGNYQYVDLVESVAGVGGMSAARHLARDARVALGLVIPGAPVSEEAPVPVSRRGFLRVLTGRR
jgi:[NiFe] hydrogenase assembly HybE family chaperone